MVRLAMEKWTDELTAEDIGWAAMSEEERRQLTNGALRIFKASAKVMQGGAMQPQQVNAFDWLDYVRRRDVLGYHAIVALTASETAAFERGDYPPPPIGMQRQAGMGEQPSVTDRDLGDESGVIREATERYADFAPILYQRPVTTPADAEARIAVLEAEVAKLRAQSRPRLSAGWESLPDVTAPEPKQFPSRALRFSA